MPDRVPVRVVVIALALGFLGAIVAITFLASTQTPIPDALADIPVFSGGALAGILAKTSPSESVTIDQPPDAPVPVDPIDPAADLQP